MPETVSTDAILALPKAELHVHLDGSLRPETLLELATRQGVTPPADTPEGVAKFMHVADATNLGDYLSRFETTLAVMQTAESLDRIAYELAQDLADEGVRYAEIRYCPALHTEAEMHAEDTVEAVLRGLRRAESDRGIRTGVIVCGLRHLPPERAAELADLAVGFMPRGVVGFDLAGAEDGNPPVNFLEAFQIAADGNLAVTIHAGEAAGASSVADAVHRCGARRIGHGTRLLEDVELLEYLRDFQIPIELCLTSNVQTHAVERLVDHPLPRFLDEGMVVTLNTDNRLMSATTLSREFRLAHETFALDWDDLALLARMSFEAAFLPFPEKQEMLGAFDDWVTEVERTA